MRKEVGAKGIGTSFSSPRPQRPFRRREAVALYNLINLTFIQATEMSRRRLTEFTAPTLTPSRPFSDFAEPGKEHKVVVDFHFFGVRLGLLRFVPKVTPPMVYSDPTASTSTLDQSVTDEDGSELAQTPSAVGPTPKTRATSIGPPPRRKQVGFLIFFLYRMC